MALSEALNVAHSASPMQWVPLIETHDALCGTGLWLHEPAYYATVRLTIRPIMWRTAYSRPARVLWLLQLFWREKNFLRFHQATNRQTTKLCENRAFVGIRCRVYGVESGRMEQRLIQRVWLSVCSSGFLCRRSPHPPTCCLKRYDPRRLSALYQLAASSESKFWIQNRAKTEPLLDVWCVSRSAPQ